MATKMGLTADKDRVMVDGFCTIAEAAEFLSCSQRSIYSMMDKGELAWTKLQPGGRRIPRIALREFAAKNLHNVAPLV